MTAYHLIDSVLHVVAVVEGVIDCAKASLKNDLVRREGELIGCSDYQLAAAVHDDDVGSQFTHDFDLLMCDSQALVTHQEIVFCHALANYRVAGSTNDPRFAGAAAASAGMRDAA